MLPDEFDTEMPCVLCAPTMFTRLPFARPVLSKLAQLFVTLAVKPDDVDQLGVEPSQLLLPAVGCQTAKGEPLNVTLLTRSVPAVPTVDE